jgi:iron complex outermembrane receptor protein/outer membrane receptor for ferrienterochelin and colicins
MKKILMPLLVMAVVTVNAVAQNQLTITIKNADNREPVIGATVQITGTSLGASADENGIAILSNIPDGQQTILSRSIGFKGKSLTLTFPLAANDPIEILLEADEEELEEVIITSTRISRNIEDIPTRVESISFEEIDEKTNMRPTNVAMLLHESTGIQVQQTSYTSGTQTIRIQGLDGKYTQLLKDGFPNYGGFSSGLSILDIPPLDLKQVEIIKGSSSTLYGGGAIAGMVNFITKEPRDKREINLILNQTSVMGTDVGSFLSGRKEKIGFTFLGTVHYQKEYDVDDDDFTELPLQKEITLFPKLFLYPDEDTKIIIGNSFTRSNRLGGDVEAIRHEGGSGHGYYEENKSFRNNAYFSLTKNISETKTLTAKQSFNTFSRDLQKPDYFFSGIQTIAYTDISYSTKLNKHTFVLGANYLFDSFKENKDSSAVKRDQTLNTASLYIQDNWDITEKFLLEAGVRIDYNTTYNGFVLPRLALLYRFTKQFSARLGGGLGYKLPTLFVEETESMFFKNVLGLDDDLNPEKSTGVNLDFNFAHDFTDRFTFSFNHLFFFTEITDPLVLTENASNEFYMKNENKPVQSKGFETNARFIYGAFKFFAGYTFVDARALYKTGNNFLAITPQNKVNLVFLIEKEQNFKIGLEGYWTDNQYLNDSRLAPSYWEFGLFGEKIFKKFSLYINFENFTDTRQNKFENVVFPPHDNPTFAQVFTHTEGFIVNGGIKLRL